MAAPPGRKLGHIQALRAIAVALVVLYHLWPNRLSGGYVGVDVFFVISGYLITAHLAREMRATGHVRLSLFWARRIRRLLPASLLVIAVSTVATLLVVPQSYWLQYMREFGAAALYVENWVLAGDAVNYLAEDNTASPVQHFWSLSVEEQFYIAWPLLLVAGAAVAKALSRSRDDPRAVVAVLTTIFATSLGYSLYLTHANPDVAYFSTFTRAWEFAAGGLLACLSLRRLTLNSLAPVVAWWGLGAIVTAAAVFTRQTPFPGIAAALPVAGALAFIAAGGTDRVFAPMRWLKTQWIQWLGDASYSVYLWHWPLLILLPFVLGHELTWSYKVVVVVATVGAAAVTKTHVEDRFRRARDASRPGIGGVYAFAALGMFAIVSLAASGWLTANAQVKAYANDIESIAAAGTAECFGAASLDQGLRDACASAEWEAVFPPRVAIGSDVPHVFEDECRTGPEEAEVKPCEYGDPDGAYWVVLVGDSHAAQWAPAFERVAIERGWRLTVLYKAACAFTAAADRNRSEAFGPSCLEWNNGVMGWLDEGSTPDLVATSAVRNHSFLDDSGEESAQIAEDGFARRYRELVQRGSQVVAVVDNPQMRKQDIACVADGTDLLSECGRSADSALAREDYLTPATRKVDGAYVVDLTSYFCVNDFCPGVVGSVVVYRDTSSHLTKTYVETLTPYLVEAMEDAGARL